MSILLQTSHCAVRLLWLLCCSSSQDLIWLVNVGFSDWNICSVTADGQQTCFGPWQGQYSYTADSSTLDADSGKLYVQLESMQSGQPLFIFDTVA